MHRLTPPPWPPRCWKHPSLYAHFQSCFWGHFIKEYFYLVLYIFLLQIWCRGSCFAKFAKCCSRQLCFLSVLGDKFFLQTVVLFFFTNNCGSVFWKIWILSFQTTLFFVNCCYRPLLLLLLLLLFIIEFFGTPINNWQNFAQFTCSNYQPNNQLVFMRNIHVILQSIRCIALEWYEIELDIRVTHLQFFLISLLFQAGIYARHTKEQETYRFHMF